ncbi:MAG: DUF4965 domain-containing protein [Lachnospiraceae bacterium]|nr:DUF4965 domain-containing protein [Lachnospiraceae bacterium]
MTTTRVPSVPLVTCDPYFSIWSPADCLYDEEVCHWTGKKKTMKGIIRIDGEEYRFMGEGEEETLLQTELTISPTASVYTFTGGGILLEVSFFTPLLLTNPELVSRPASYVDFSVKSVDGKAHQIQMIWKMGEEFCYHEAEHKKMIGGIHETPDFQTAWMGKEEQTPLCHSGDDIDIDWGYLYLATGKKSQGKVKYQDGEKSFLEAVFELNVSTETVEDLLVLAYDDVASIMYFGDVLKEYWARNGKNILDIIGDAFKEHKILTEQSHLLDEWILQKAEESGGAEYGKICALAYRQAIAAHKAVSDREGNLLFLSKECDSNGCIGTVDVSYPSVPLFLMFGSEYVKGMLRPILRFAEMPVWEYDFAPHDVGRYPYATGQVYGVKSDKAPKYPHNGKVFPMYYLYPAGSDIYRYDMQMPVEECGDMLILAAAVTEKDGNTDFIRPYMNLMRKWANYLLAYGEDPGQQLCTDDFAGHLARNVNLAAKAIMGIESFGRLLMQAGEKVEGEIYHRKAVALAESWEQNALEDDDHTVLAYGKNNSWSLKYNLVWDKILGSNLFSDSIFEQETDWYAEKMNAYGVPLDSRNSYTKSDWILWIVAMTQDRRKREKLIEPIFRFLRETDSRNPFPDWYDTITAKEMHFHNRTVQGGLFMPIYIDSMRK